MMKVKVRLFGAFRQVGSEPVLELLLEPGARVEHAREALHGLLQRRYPGFKGADLVQQSAFADSERVLSDETPLSPESEIAILPPVCGG